jgi:UDP-2-acetamido-2,6-beta-L-arabino-hexul-4-ose reductase
MFEAPFEVHKLTLHRDERGDLFEILRFTDDSIPPTGYIYAYTVNPGARRGDHYHERKHEWVTCVSGAFTVLLEDKEGNKERAYLSAESPAVVYFAPSCVHAILNESDEVAVAVSYGSTPHDPNDPDTIMKFIA